MKKILSVICIVAMLFVIMPTTVKATDSQQDYYNNSVGIEARATEANQKNLDQNQPPPQIQWSLERDNLIKRIKLWNDPNKIGYVYLVSCGKVMSNLVIKGKISSVNSKLTTNLQVVKDPNYSDSNNHHKSVLMESPDFDGSYGTNGNAIFGFTTDGMYFEWNDEYLLVDQPFNLLTPPALSQQVK